MHSNHNIHLGGRKSDMRASGRCQATAQRRLILLIFGMSCICNSNVLAAADISYGTHVRSDPNSRVTTSNYESVQLPISRLDLIVTGTLVGTTTRAIIRVEGRKEQTFSVGEEITAGVVLTNIYPREVVISRAGISERLEWNIRSVTPNVAKNSSDTIAEPEVTSPESVVREQNDIAGSTRRSFAKDLFESPDLVTPVKLVRAPMGGIQVIDPAPGGVYAQLGLASGDAIRSINGTSVNNVADFVNLLAQRSNTDGLVIGIERGNSSYNLKYDPVGGIEVELTSVSGPGH